MVATAAVAAFLPIASPASDSSGKTPGKIIGGIPASVDARGTSAKSKSKSSGKLQVKASAQALPKVNGTKVGTMDGLKTEDEVTLSPPPRTFINQLPDWSMLLAAITTIFLAAEKQWMMLDWKPKRPDMLVDPFGLGRIVQDGNGPEPRKNAGLLADGFGSTPEMCKRNLIWVVTKMQVLVDRYPTWGDVVQVDTWVAASGKNGMRRDWLVRDSNTGDVLTRASSLWVMMNKETRRLSKIPDEVREEIGGYFVDSPPIVDDDTRKLPKLDDNTADYIHTGLTPRWSDLDVNQHVNNVKYVGWILEFLELVDDWHRSLNSRACFSSASRRILATRVESNYKASAPLPILETHELAGMTLEYRRECMRDSVLQSLTSVVNKGVGDLATNGFVECQHLLRLEGGGEIVKGRTLWRPKYVDMIGSLGQLPPENA
ncbi:hypothetical protein DH2020_039365 [Rehmannia glutinosa]|uniref:Acyl-[acyl-carrier-protein] hydrolase n=1 Tax=Rehmannia glutinosa TaxID=99300 RepID=A0ABR0UW16_REHGL